MLAALIVLGLALVLTLIALIVIVRELLTRHATSEASWGDERRELLNRIQRPEFLPVASPGNYVIPEQEPDEIGQVGAINFDTEALLAD